MGEVEFTLPTELAARFKLVGEIQRGGMGVVYEAIDRELGRPVALKVLDVEADERSRQRFIREGRALAGLRHPNIVQLFNSGLSAGRPYLLMELVKGQSLEDWVLSALRKGALPSARELERVFGKIAGALDYCHERGVLHRDVKPSNILIRLEDGEPVLVDFGIVRRASGDKAAPGLTKSLTRSGEVVGTPHYMAPEQLDSEEFGEIGPAADVWGLGATLFFCLTGETPFEKTSRISHMINLTSKQPRSIWEFNNDAPQALVELCKSCLRREQGQRPSLKTFQEAFKKALVAPSEGRRGLWWGLGALVLALVTFLSLLASLSSSEVKLEELSFEGLKPVIEEESFASRRSLATASPELLVRGRVSEAGVTIQVGEREKAESNAEGLFSVRLKLVEGENKLLIRALDREPEFLQSVEVTLDRKAPLLDLKATEMPRETFYGPGSEEKARIYFSPGAELRGVLRDKAGAGRLSCNKQDCAVDEKGRFAIKLVDDGSMKRLTLAYQDRVGNGAVRELLVLTPKAQVLYREGEELAKRREEYLKTVAADEKQRALWLLACRLKLWDAADPGQRAAFVGFVAERLGGDFEALGLKSYRCGDQLHELGSFRHRKTGVVFRLVPGDSYQARCYWRPEFEYMQTYLEALQSQRITPRMVFISYLMPPTPSFREELEARFQFDFSKLDRTVKTLLPRAGKVLERFKARPELLREFRVWVRGRMDYLRPVLRYRELRGFVKPFLLAERELTHGQWKRLSALPDFASPFDPFANLINNNVKARGDDYPMWMSRERARSWLALAGFRLPDRHEWLHACQAGSKHRYFWGDDHEKGKDYVVSLGAGSIGLTFPRQLPEEFGRNGFGLVDMLGNVAEWADPDWASWKRLWPEKRPEKTFVTKERQVNYEDLYLGLGGHCRLPAPLCRSDLLMYRHSRNNPMPSYHFVGLRPALSIP